MAKRKKRKETIYVGTITVMDQLKMAQEWLGPQRKVIHKTAKDYTRKQKHKGKLDYDRHITKVMYVL